MDTNKTLKKYEPMIRKIAFTFASSNSSAMADADDYYQEAYMIALNVLRSGGYQKAKGSFTTYLWRSIYNELVHTTVKWNCMLKTNPKVIKLCTKIFNLEVQDYTPEQIQSILNISSKKYYQVRNLLRKDSNLMCYQVYEMTINNPQFAEIRSRLNYDDLCIFDMCAREFSIKEIAINMEKSHEWARIKVVNLFQKIREIYDE